MNLHDDSLLVPIFVGILLCFILLFDTKDLLNDIQQDVQSLLQAAEPQDSEEPTR